MCEVWQNLWLNASVTEREIGQSSRMGSSSDFGMSQIGDALKEACESDPPSSHASVPQLSRDSLELIMRKVDPGVPPPSELGVDEQKILAHKAELDHSTLFAGIHARAVCREWRSAYDTTHIHLFMLNSGVAGRFPLPPCDSFRRWQLHEKAARLLFVHESEGNGVNRHIVLRHPKNETDRKAAVARPAPKPKRRQDRVSPHHNYWDDELSSQDETNPECFKCGYHTWRDFCPECGRPMDPEYWYAMERWSHRGYR